MWARDMMIALLPLFLAREILLRKRLPMSPIDLTNLIGVMRNARIMSLRGRIPILMSPRDRDERRMCSILLRPRHQEARRPRLELFLKMRGGARSLRDISRFL